MAMSSPTAAAPPIDSVRDLITDVLALVIEVKAEVAVAQTQLQKLEKSLVALNQALGLSDDQIGKRRDRDELDDAEEREHKRLKQVFQTRKPSGTPTLSLGSASAFTYDGSARPLKHADAHVPSVAAALPNDQQEHFESTLVLPH